MKRDLIYSFLCMLFICFTACEDELLREEDDFTPGAKSTVTAIVEFKPLVPALNGASRTAGDAIKEINDLWVLLYSEDGNLVESYKIKDFNQTTVDRQELTSGGPYAESRTSRATFNLVIPQGSYYIYAIANLDLTSYQEAIKTVDGLKNISLTWKDKIEENNQMFGYFSEDSRENENVIHVTPELLTINKNMKLHAWVRRVASKVTIAYDGSQLEEGVFIYLKSVKIKDIPRECLLGNDNHVVDVKALITNGETINYYPEAPSEPSYDETWPARITAGMPYYPCQKEIDENGKTIYKISDGAHSETADALFFYENMQGRGRSKKQVKDGVIAHPVVMDEEGNYKKDEDGNVIYDPGSYKDEKPCGTYIEVEAYYKSINKERVGSGKIIYRFMLGKDVDMDYDAERNYHYKLTLCFKKFANDVDWHIEYEEKRPDILLPDKYYISYLYNHSMDMPFKINTGGQKLVALKAKIIFNNWAPYNATDLKYARQHDYAYTSDPNDNAPWNGFLSLRKTTATLLTNQAQASVSQGIVKVKDNESYYNEHHRGDREYNVAEGVHTDTDGDYSVKYENKGELVNVSVPLYTRAKQMIINTGYTGNNPFVAYQRHAKVEFTATIEDEDKTRTELKGTSQIFQVRRIVNPKGIYRSEKNNAPFHVKLLRLSQENGTTFESFTSEGAWRAYVVVGDPNFITLDGKAEATGKTGSEIDFNVEFTGKCPENGSRHAIIRVEYHNYSCYHLIFVQQGEAPVELIPGGTKWHTRNLLSATAEVTSPVDEGSLFKFGNVDQPIAASNQVHEKEGGYWINIQPSDFKSNDASKDFKIVGANESKKWSEITFSTEKSSPDWLSKLNLPKGGRIACYADYEALLESADIEQGYGVLYGDEAGAPATDRNDAYGYKSEGSKADCGMRGCFVYNKKTGYSVFFPIGASGYGRRKRKDDYGAATLRYAERMAEYPDPGLKDRPLFYDLYMRPGAIYWLERAAEADDTKEVLGWDFNYYTFDFNWIHTSNVFENGNSDACLVRCVD